MCALFLYSKNLEWVFRGSVKAKQTPFIASVSFRLSLGVASM